MITRRRLLASSLLPFVFAGGTKAAAASATQAPWLNWSGYLRAEPAGRVAPGSTEELAAWLAKTSGKVRPVGSAHSFSPLVPTKGHLLVLDRLSGLDSLLAASSEAVFHAGTRLSDTGQPLWQAGQAMFNLPDIDRQTIAGALATSTHGTGARLQSLSGYVSGLELVTASGEILVLDAGHEFLPAAAVSLGALGVITKATFRNRAPFRVRTRTWVEETTAILDKFDQYCREWQHFEMMPLLHSDYALAIAHQETEAELQPPPGPDDDSLLTLIGATPVPLRGALINSLAQTVEPTESVQRSYEALTNVRMTRFNEMEYSVPADVGADCLLEVMRAVAENAVDVVIPLEYRIIDADDTWLSMFTGSPRVSISVHRLAGEDFNPLFNLVEPIFWKYGGRPHWGKWHSLGHSELRALYPKFDDFTRLRQELDPAGRLLNPHLAKLFGVEA